MTNYRYTKGELVGTHDVIELSTGHIIMKNQPIAKARELTRRLNFGAGFAGWTPEFFLNDMPLEKNNF